MEKDPQTEPMSHPSSYQNPRTNPDIPSDLYERASGQNFISFSSISTMGKSFSHGRKVKLKHVPGPLPENTLKGVADYIQSGKCKKIVVLSGAGISTSAGIPDFRSPSVGIYSILEKFGIPSPQSVFDIDYFRMNPYPFYNLCSYYSDLLNGAKPTLSHFFIKLLANKNILLRLYTQNVDGLEQSAGINKNAHGSLSTCSCINCRTPFKLETFLQCVLSETICYCSNCNGMVKPDIVFFGERLPDHFFENVEHDCKNCDLMIICGTSLHVYPISLITQLIPPDVPRLFINNEKVCPFKTEEDYSPLAQSECSSVNDVRKDGSEFASVNDEKLSDRVSGVDEATDETIETMELIIHDRDVVWLGSTDDGFKELAKHLGWDSELDMLISAFYSPS